MFKTVFFLALGSGKGRSKIHAWFHRTLDIKKIGLMPPNILQPAPYLRVFWPGMDQIV